MIEKSKDSYGKPLEQCVGFLIMASAINLMTGSRNEAYNFGGIEIKDYFDDLNDSFQMVKVKFLRIRSLSARLEYTENPSENVLMELADNCIDLLNFAGFHLATALRRSKFDGTFFKIKEKYKAHDLYYCIQDFLKAFEEGKDVD